MSSRADEVAATAAETATSLEVRLVALLREETQTRQTDGQELRWAVLDLRREAGLRPGNDVPAQEEAALETAEVLAADLEMAFPVEPAQRARVIRRGVFPGQELGDGGVARWSYREWSPRGAVFAPSCSPELAAAAKKASGAGGMAVFRRGVLAATAVA